jgi:hypothetical protein
MLLSRDWSEKLNGYFSTNYAHLWFPLKGHPNIQTRSGLLEKDTSNIMSLI